MDKIISFLIILKNVAVSAGRWIQAHNGFISAIATAVIAAFTVTLWLTNRKLWKATIGLLRVSQQHSRHMEKSLAISKETADAAKKSSEVAEETLRITQAPELDIIGYKFYRTLEVDNKPQIIYEITNLGNTVAHITEIKQIVDIVSEFPIAPDYSKCNILSKDLLIRRTRTATKTATMNRPITADQIINIQHRSNFLGLWGTITYHDVFHKKFTIGFGIKYTPGSVKDFAFIDGYNYINEHEEEEQS